MNSGDKGSEDGFRTNFNEQERISMTVKIHDLRSVTQTNKQTNKTGHKNCCLKNIEKGEIKNLDQ